MTEKESKNEKIFYLDCLRVLAMFSVILIHIFVTAKTDFTNKTFIDNVVTEIFSQILHFGVPIFFMITGVLFLDKNKKISIKKMYKKYILKYVLGIVIFGWFFALIECIFSSPFSFKLLITSFINMVEGKSWAHMWYLYSLIGVLITVPVIKFIIDNDKDEKITNYLLYILIFSSSIIPLINTILNIKIGIQFIISSEYLAYMILGYKINKIQQINYKRWIYLLIVMMIILMVANTIYVIYGIEIAKSLGTYNSPVIFVIAISLFIIFKEKIKKGKLDKIINKISELSYGVYIVHMFWINIFYKFLKISPYGVLMSVKIIGLFLIITILSMISSFILKKIPVIKKLV